MLDLCKTKCRQFNFFGMHEGIWYYVSHRQIWYWVSHSWSVCIRVSSWMPKVNQTMSSNIKNGGSSKKWKWGKRLWNGGLKKDNKIFQLTHHHQLQELLPTTSLSWGKHRWEMPLRYTCQLYIPQEQLSLLEWCLQMLENLFQWLEDPQATWFPCPVHQWYSGARKNCAPHVPNLLITSWSGDWHVNTTSSLSHSSQYHGYYLQP